MRLPLIKQLSNFIAENDSDFITESIKVLEDLCDARGIKDEELDVIGELLSNMEGSLEVQKLIEEGASQREALNAFMKRVTSIGK
jgi:vesicle coat complex subunit